MHEPKRRPHLVTAVGLIVIFAGIFPIVELGIMLVSPSFSAFFLPLVQKILPVNTEVMLVSLPLIGLGDIVLGAGVLLRRRWAMFGMILRSVAGILADYLNIQIGNALGAGIAFAVNLFLILALLLPKSRLRFRNSSTDLVTE
jgi:hypothetical protein